MADARRSSLGPPSPRPSAPTSSPPSTPAPSTGTPPRHGLLSPLLQLGTAATLFTESVLPHGTSAAATSARVALGYGQRGLGFGGMAYYGHKAWKEGGAGNWGMLAGYSAFTAHGYARMLEASSGHAPHTAATGAAAAGFKALSSGGASAPGFIADMAANVTELGHSLHHPTSAVGRAVSAAAHHVTPEGLVRMQRGGAAALASAALYKVYSHFKGGGGGASGGSSS